MVGWRVEPGAKYRFLRIRLLPTGTSDDDVWRQHSLFALRFKDSSGILLGFFTHSPAILGLFFSNDFLIQRHGIFEKLPGIFHDFLWDSSEILQRFCGILQGFLRDSSGIR